MSGLSESDDSLLKWLHRIIRIAVRGLAVLMTILIVLGVVDVAWMLLQKGMNASPKFVLSISDILATFGAFMAVLIAIEIFVNITMYLREDVIHVRIVVATALMAISRKVIILDFRETSSDFVWATAGVILAVGLTYWLLARSEAAASPNVPQSVAKALAPSRAVEANTPEPVNSQPAENVD